MQITWKTLLSRGDFFKRNCLSISMNTKLREAAVMRLEFNRNDGCEKCKSGN